MPKTIQQTVTLPAPAEELYRMYVDPKRHAAITGALTAPADNHVHFHPAPKPPRADCGGAFHK